MLVLSLDERQVGADGRGSNGYRTRLWKQHLQVKVVDHFDLTVTVCHYPLSAFKWNLCDLRLFSQISKTGPGRRSPLLNSPWQVFGRPPLRGIGMCSWRLARVSRRAGCALPGVGKALGRVHIPTVAGNRRQSPQDINLGVIVGLMRAGEPDMGIEV
jgi:hypothetical protein